MGIGEDEPCGIEEESRACDMNYALLDLIKVNGCGRDRYYRGRDMRYEIGRGRGTRPGLGVVHRPSLLDCEHRCQQCCKEKQRTQVRWRARLMTLPAPRCTSHTGRRAHQPPWFLGSPGSRSPTGVTGCAATRRPSIA